MTALTAGTREVGARRRLLPASLTAMAWVIWRQHRTTLIWLGGLLLVIGMTMLVAGIELHRLYAAEIRHGCLGSSAWSATCQPLQNTFDFSWPASYENTVSLVMQAVPVIIGVFLGAPLLAREYTAGTVRFTWTQGIGRTRWAAATVGLLGAAVAAAVCLLGLLAQWSTQPVAAQGNVFAGRWQPGFFDSTTLTAATASLLAFTIGVLAGTLIRRVVAAMAVTTAGAITAAYLTFYRVHYWLVSLDIRVARDAALGADPNVGVATVGGIDLHEAVSSAAPGPAGAWLDQGWYTRAHGQRLSAGAVARLLSKHADSGAGWLARLHDTFWVSYQPGWRYWVFQSVVGGGTLLLALLLGAATIGLICYRRR
jgi:ABC-type transport system involved in multi-copper enzyme maturation permease subunit